ncbi:alpha/beta hydrolase [Paenibacillus sp. GCM10027629]|uniref:alpha/beta hydrolase n=1 Tax=Paenibacillus sp. GCM10027629 TaxID=3273414 RepID=UPI00363EBFF0
MMKVFLQFKQFVTLNPLFGLRGNSDDLGVDPNKIVVCGSSAGGYIAVSLCLRM